MSRCRLIWANTVVVIVVVAVTGPKPVQAGPGAASEPSQFDLAAAATVKIVLRKAGWTRVRQPALLAAGLDPAVDPGQLRLFADGVEQAVLVTGNGDASFDADEAIEFYGLGRDTLWTDARTYWLTVGPGGKRIPLVANPGGSVGPGSFPDTAELRERTIYYAALKNGDDSNFFGAVVNPTGVTRTVGVRHLDATGPIALRVRLQGVTAGTHDVAISLNGQGLGNCRFEGQTLETCASSPAAVVEGDNQVTLVAQGLSPDESLVDVVDIDYARTYAYTAGAGGLRVTAPPASRVTIGGFSSPNARVVDVTDAAQPVALVTGMSSNGTTYLAGVNTSGATSARTLLVFTEGDVQVPASVVANRPSAWFETLDGDFVILSPAQFLEAARPLAARRAQQGWSVQLVDLQDVYDEFSDGDKTPFAIRDFLRYAHDTWRVPPRFVLLLGDATFDPRNFLGLGDFDFAPTKLIDAQSMETASDDWFVDWNGDGVPEIATGRIPVRTAAEAATVIQKTLSYAGVPDLAKGGLFVTDQNADGLEFEDSSQQGAAAVSDLMPVDSFLFGQPASTPAALLEKLNRGPFLVDYTGHGSVAIWDGLFSGDDAATLTNPHLSIYVSMNCLNGFFHDLYTESLAESLLKAPQGGAVAVWASSTLTSFAPQTVLNREFLKRLTRTSLGEAAIAAKQAITDDDARRTWILFGDPTLFGTPVVADGSAPDAGIPSDGSAPDGGLPGEAGVGASARDAGASDGVPGGPDLMDAAADRGRSLDGSSTPSVAAGCGCRTAPGGDPPGPLLLGLGTALGVVGRRRNRQQTQASGRDR